MPATIATIVPSGAATRLRGRGCDLDHDALRAHWELVDGAAGQRVVVDRRRQLAAVAHRRRPRSVPRPPHRHRQPGRGQPAVGRRDLRRPALHRRPPRPGATPAAAERQRSANSRRRAPNVQHSVATFRPCLRAVSPRCVHRHCSRSRRVGPSSSSWATDDSHRRSRSSSCSSQRSPRSCWCAWSGVAPEFPSDSRSAQSRSCSRLPSSSRPDLPRCLVVLDVRPHRRGALARARGRTCRRTSRTTRCSAGSGRRGATRLPSTAPCSSRRPPASPPSPATRPWRHGSSSRAAPRS